MSRAWTTSLLWGLIIFILCAIPGKNLPHYTWADLLSVDKLVHFSMFLILCVLIKRAWALSENKPRPSMQNFIVIPCCMIYGGMLELMQNYCYTDRSGSWFDFLANSIGAIAGALLFLKLFSAEGEFLFFSKKNHS